MRKEALSAAVIALLLAAPAAAYAQCETPEAPLRPVMATHTLPPYPEMSVMTKEEGTSLLQVEIGPDGAPSNVTVVQTSGSVRLDEASRDYVKDVWRWRPPLKSCQPQASVTRVSIKWDIKNAPQGSGLLLPVIPLGKPDYPPDAFERREQGVTQVLIIITDKGAIASTRVSKSSGFADLDAKAQEIIRTRYRWTPPLMDGKPVLGSVLLAMQWQLAPPK